MTSSTTSTALRTAKDRLVLGSAPDSWGVWFPDDTLQTPWPRFLDELADSGYAWLELGPYGYLPTDPARLNEEVGARGLRVSGGTVFGDLHNPRNWDDTLATVRAVAELTAAVGAHHLVLIPPMYRDQRTGAFTESPTLDAGQWSHLTRAADELGRVLLGDYDVRLCVHSHADTHVQTQPEIERLLNETDPDLVSLCLDTGHVAYGGGDAVDLIRRYRERIGYVHIKQMDPEIIRQVRQEQLGFGEAVRRGVCVEPPAGEPAPAAVVDALAEVDARVFVIVEQDLYPCDFETPKPIAERTRRYLNSCGLGARHQHRP